MGPSGITPCLSEGATLSSDTIRVVLRSSLNSETKQILIERNVTTAQENSERPA